MARDHGVEDVRYVPIEQSTNVAAVMPGGRSPGLLADSIQPVLVLGDGKGSSSASNEITQSSFCSGMIVFGSQVLGGPYYEFHAQKAPAGPVARAIVSGLAGFLDAFIPLPVFGITVGGATAERAERAVVVYDVIVTWQVGGASGPALSIMGVGFDSSPFRPLRPMGQQTITVPGQQGEQGDEPLAPESRFYGGHLFGNLPHGLNPPPGVHVIYQPKGMYFWFLSTAEMGNGFRPFQALTPFWMPQDSLFFIGQTDFNIGVANGTDSAFGVNVIWKELPL